MTENNIIRQTVRVLRIPYADGSRKYWAIWDDGRAMLYATAKNAKRSIDNSAKAKILVDPKAIVITTINWEL